MNLNKAGYYINLVLNCICVCGLCRIPKRHLKRILILKLHFTLLTYSLEQSPWESNWFAASQEIPHILRYPKFITAFTTARHLSLFWANFIQSIPPLPTSWRFILILSTHLCLGLPSGLFPSGFPTKTLCTSLLPHTCYMPCPSHSSRFDHCNNKWWGAQIIKLLIMYFFSLPLYLISHRPKYFPQHPFLKDSQPMFLP